MPYDIVCKTNTFRGCNVPEYASRFAVPEAELVPGRDGSAILRNRIALAVSPETVLDRLDQWARERPEQVFLSEPHDAGRRLCRYAEFAAMTGDAAAQLADIGLRAGDRIAIIAENGIDHAVWLYGAMRLGVVSAVLSAGLARSATGIARLNQMLETVDVRLILSDCLEKLTGLLPANLPAMSLGIPRRAKIGPPPRTPRHADVAKILFTSGSTGAGKAVPNTHGMMASNMQALLLVWPFLIKRTPVLVDWLPWSHTFGGNCCFNLALWNGGTFHIDHGRPVPGLGAQSWTAVKELDPTVYFNVPAGFAILVAEMEADPTGAAKFLGGLDFLFNAGAALPASTRSRLEVIARDTIGRVPPIIGAWGATETAPASTAIYFQSPHAGQLGLPLPGTEIKLVPNGAVTELRVKGPNVFTGYLGDPQATADAFDADGFYRIGDAGLMADPEDPSAGIVFDGRVAENFKLTSGTWVNVGALRLALASALGPYVRDLVVLGEGRDVIAVLLFAPRDGPPPDGADAAVGAILAGYNRTQLGSSNRIARFAWAVSPLVPGQEVTDKGYVNQRAVIRGRASEVAAVYACGQVV